MGRGIAQVLGDVSSIGYLPNGVMQGLGMCEGGLGARKTGSQGVVVGCEVDAGSCSAAAFNAWGSSCT